MGRALPTPDEVTWLGEEEVLIFIRLTMRSARPSSATSATHSSTGACAFSRPPQATGPWRKACPENRSDERTRKRRSFGLHAALQGD